MEELIITTLGAAAAGLYGYLMFRRKPAYITLLVLLSAVTFYFVADAVLDPNRWNSGKGLLAAMWVFALVMTIARTRQRR
jgi:hypothetical protein